MGTASTTATPAPTQTGRHRIERRFFYQETGEIYPSLADIPKPRKLDRQALSLMLRIGYVPGNRTLIEGVTCLPGGMTFEVEDGHLKELDRFRFKDVLDPNLGTGSEEVLRKRAGSIFMSAVQRCLGEDGQVVVPMSGGLDSRACLAALLECLEPGEIQTYTYGQPGTLDFETGNMVARRAGTRHTVIDLGRFRFSRERLEKTAQISDANTDLMQPIVWTEILDLFPDGRFWTGFTGDGIGGSHYKPKRTITAAEARQNYLAGASREHHYHPADHDEPFWPELVAADSIYKDAISLEEELFFANHVERYTAHHIFMNTASYANPFMDTDFMAFFWSIDPALREGKTFFNDAMRTRFPGLFSLQTKDYGFMRRRDMLKNIAFRANDAARKALWRVFPRAVNHPRMSYIDYITSIRHRHDVRTLVRDALDSLKTRDILDNSRIETLWLEHQSGKREHAYTLTLLTSIEAAISALDIQT